MDNVGIFFTFCFLRSCHAVLFDLLVPLPLSPEPPHGREDEQHSQAQEEETIDQEGGSQMGLWHIHLDQVDRLLRKGRRWRKRTVERCSQHLRGIGRIQNPGATRCSA
jgi:hypothetical protein